MGNVGYKRVKTDDYPSMHMPGGMGYHHDGYNTNPLTAHHPQGGPFAYNRDGKKIDSFYFYFIRRAWFKPRIISPVGMAKNSTFLLTNFFRT
jgi:hypothetical protein